MYFPSIRDKWITGIVWIISLLGILFPLLKGQVTIMFIMFGLAAFLLWFWFRTGYKIEGDKIKSIMARFGRLFISRTLN
ncbi:hypothetical protein [Oceanobacillus indicireducens]|uniref:Uncharacterized protein n=1 Tax=Oceanobacillus indicireducens TaxID=1004261 RepID=A0A918D2C8_9BACI|nr:hypothetical protein [Oceanobacillus indicireducens]GGN59240.1 hypothetical protein GCM10007971_22140 [Oceanobacillus indicireducens]